MFLVAPLLCFSIFALELLAIDVPWDLANYFDDLEKGSNTTHQPIEAMPDFQIPEVTVENNADGLVDQKLHKRISSDDYFNDLDDVEDETHIKGQSESSRLLPELQIGQSILTDKELDMALLKHRDLETRSYSGPGDLPAITGARQAASSNLQGESIVQEKPDMIDNSKTQTQYRVLTQLPRSLKVGVGDNTVNLLTAPIAPSLPTDVIPKSSEEDLWATLPQNELSLSERDLVIKASSHANSVQDKYKARSTPQKRSSIGKFNALKPSGRLSSSNLSFRDWQEKARNSKIVESRKVADPNFQMTPPTPNPPLSASNFEPIPRSKYQDVMHKSDNNDLLHASDDTTSTVTQASTTPPQGINPTLDSASLDRDSTSSNHGQHKIASAVVSGVKTTIVQVVANEKLMLFNVNHEGPGVDCWMDCGEHGQCIKGNNYMFLVACRCDTGWAGRTCNVTTIYNTSKTYANIASIPHHDPMFPRFSPPPHLPFVPPRNKRRVLSSSPLEMPWGTNPSLLQMSSSSEGLQPGPTDTSQPPCHLWTEQQAPKKETSNLGEALQLDRWVPSINILGGAPLSRQGQAQKFVSSRSGLLRRFDVFLCVSLVGGQGARLDADIVDFVTGRRLAKKEISLNISSEATNITELNCPADARWYSLNVDPPIELEAGRRYAIGLRAWDHKAPIFEPCTLGERSSGSSWLSQGFLEKPELHDASLQPFDHCVYKQNTSLVCMETGIQSSSACWLIPEVLWLQSSDSPKCYPTLGGGRVQGQRDKWPIFPSEAISSHFFPFVFRTWFIKNSTINNSSSPLSAQIVRGALTPEDEKIHQLNKEPAQLGERPLYVLPTQSRDM